MKKIIEKKVKYTEQEIDLKIFSKNAKEYYLEVDFEKAGRLELTASMEIIADYLHDMLDRDDYNNLIQYITGGGY